jgi:hypothetical protein
MIAESQILSKDQVQQSARRLCLQIGGVLLGLNAREMGIQFDPDHERFRVPNAICDVEIDVEWASDLTPADGAKVFDSGAVWTLYDAGRDYIFDFSSVAFGASPYKRLYIDKIFSRGRVLLRRDCFSDESNIFALEYPLGELIVTNWLAHGRGVEVHGCGITDDACSSCLFIGHSGAGKSTTTRLWQSLPGVRILSDDRIILRKQAGGFLMYGTPWHGEAGFALPDKAPVSRIFILEHGERNEIVPLTRPAAAAEIFSRCFLPFHDPQALTDTLAYLDDLTRAVPCYKFQFLPNHSAVEKILEFQRPR